MSSWLPTCNVCQKHKAPRGRSVPMEAASGYCTWECAGYAADPVAPTTWTLDEEIALGDHGRIVARMLCVGTRTGRHEWRGDEYEGERDWCCRCGVTARDIVDWVLAWEIKYRCSLTGPAKADSFYAGKAFERQQQRDALGDDEHGRKSW